MRPGRVVNLMQHYHYGALQDNTSFWRLGRVIKDMYRHLGRSLKTLPPLGEVAK